jgi:hypothetical protein
VVDGLGRRAAAGFLRNACYLIQGVDGAAQVRRREVCADPGAQSQLVAACGAVRKSSIARQPDHQAEDTAEQRQRAAWPDPMSIASRWSPELLPSGGGVTTCAGFSDGTTIGKRRDGERCFSGHYAMRS